MGNLFSYPDYNEHEKRMNEFERRILELEQRVFLGLHKNKQGNLIQEPKIEYTSNPLKQSLLENPNKPGVQDPSTLYNLFWGDNKPLNLHNQRHNKNNE